MVGFFAFQEFYDKLIAELPEGASIVEVGCLAGKSIAYLAQRSKETGKNFVIHGVDTFKGDPGWDFVLGKHAYNESFFPLYRENLEKAGVWDLVNTHCLPSLAAAALFKDKSLDCVFIDALHDEENCTADIIAWRPKVKDGGILCGDDYDEPWGVIPAVQKNVPGFQLVGKAWWVKV